MNGPHIADLTRGLKAGVMPGLIYSMSYALVLLSIPTLFPGFMGPIFWERIITAVATLIGGIIFGVVWSRNSGCLIRRAVHHAGNTSMREKSFRTRYISLNIEPSTTVTRAIWSRTRIIRVLVPMLAGYTHIFILQSS